MNLEKRNIGMCIFLSIITCGIYGLYWIYKVGDDMGVVKKDGQSEGAKILFFAIISCHIYYVYWIFKSCKAVYYAQEDLGMRASDNSLIAIILSVCGLDIVSLAILQSSLNDIADETAE